MEIAIFNEFFKPHITGGADIFLDKLSQFLANQGFKIRLVTTKFDDTKEYEKNGNLEIFRISSSPLNFKHFKQIPGLTLPYNFYNFKLQDFCKKIIDKSDVVHLNNLYHLSMAPLQAAKNLNKKIVFDIHDYWPMCFRKDFLYKGKDICNFNDPFHCASCLGPAYIPGFPLLALEFMKRNSLVKTGNIVVHSRTVQKRVKDYMELDSSVIPYSFAGKILKDHERFLDRKLRLLFMGRLQKQKGAHILPEVSQLLDAKKIDHEIIVLGDGELMGQLKEEIEKENLKIKLMGFISDRDEIYNFLGMSDILLVPSVYEPFGIVVLEAMSAGIPVVGTNIGGVEELINKNEVGLTCIPDAGELVRCIIKLQKNTKLYLKFSANGLKNIKNYEERIIFKRYVKLFEQT